MLNRILGFCLLVGASVYCQETSDKQFQEDYGRLLEQMGQAMVENYFDPLSGNLGAAYNGIWATGFPSREIIELKPSVSIVGGFSYVRSSWESFSTEVEMELTPALASKLVESVDLESFFGKGIPEDVKNELAGEVRSQVVSGLLKDDPKYKVTVFGPSIIGSQKDTVKMAWERKIIEIPYEYELPSPRELAEKEGVTGEALDRLSDKRELVRGSENVEIPKQVVSTGLFGLMDGLPIVPSVAPQITIGSILGTQFVGRYVPEVMIGNDEVELGTIEYLGWSVQHDLTFWLQKWVDWNLMFIYSHQSVEAFDMLELSTSKVGFMFGERFDILGLWSVTPYLTWTYDRNSLKIDFSKGYQFLEDALENPSPTPLDIELEYVTRWKRQTSVGLIINLFSVLELQAEGSVGKYTNAFLRAAVGF